MRYISFSNINVNTWYPLVKVGKTQSNSKNFKDPLQIETYKYGKRKTKSEKKSKSKPEKRERLVKWVLKLCLCSLLRDLRASYI